jgi:hypothetical protein
MVLLKVQRLRCAVDIVLGYSCTGLSSARPQTSIGSTSKHANKKISSGLCLYTQQGAGTLLPAVNEFISQHRYVMSSILQPMKPWLCMTRDPRPNLSYFHLFVRDIIRMHQALTCVGVIVGGEV